MNLIDESGNKQEMKHNKHAVKRLPGTAQPACVEKTCRDWSVLGKWVGNGESLTRDSFSKLPASWDYWHEILASSIKVTVRRFCQAFLDDEMVHRVHVYTALVCPFEKWGSLFHFHKLRGWRCPQAKAPGPLAREKMSRFQPATFQMTSSAPPRSAAYVSILWRVRKTKMN